MQYPTWAGAEGGAIVARYLRTLAEHGVDAVTWGAISTTAVFGDATIAVHATSDALWRWRANAGVRAVAATIFVLRGKAIVRPWGQSEFAAASGDAFLFHSGRTAEVDWAEGSQYLVLLLPADAVVGSGIEPESLPASFERTPLLAASRSFAAALASERGPTARFSAYASERLLAEMAFSLVLEGREASRGEKQRTGLSDQARTIMLVRRAEPDLTAASIAADLHISPRQLQRAFARDGQTPAAALRQLRVNLAESMLADPQYDGLSIQQVARFSGFNSGSVMRRAFEAEGVAAPRTVRRTRAAVAG